MKRKIWMGLCLCLLLSACSSAEAPQLLEPIGETSDSAKVIKGEMYNISTYDSAVTSEYKEVKLPNAAMIKEHNVRLGENITAGSPILTLDNESAGVQNQDIDAKIAELEADNAYLNQIEEYDIQIMEYELQLMKDRGEDINEIQKVNGTLKERRSKFERTKIEQQKEIAELQLAKEEGASGGGEIVSPWDGTIVYLNSGASGTVLDTGTVVAIVAKKDSKILFGEFIELETVENAHRIYARIGEKEYNVTNVPYDSIELNQREFFKLPLYSTFYIEEAPEITQGMYASIVVISDYIENALQIPENALLSDEEGYYVYKKMGKEFVRQNVSVGNMTDTAIEITKGLKEGDEVYVKP